MQTLEEYRKYTKQLEEEVGKWHHAYDALMVERNDLVKKVMNLEGEIKKANAIIDAAPSQESNAEIDTLANGSRNLNEAIEVMASELKELRKHELAWDLDKAIIKELEAKISTHEKNTGKLIEAYEQKLEAYRRRITAQESELSEMAMHVAHLETELEQKEK